MKENYYSVTSHRIGEIGLHTYHWLITEWDLNADCHGVSIQYIEKDRETDTMTFPVEVAMKLRNILNKINFEALE